MNNNDKQCCKWCEHCMNTDLKNNKGMCYVDIHELIVNTEESYCSDYRFDEDLDRC